MKILAYAKTGVLLVVQSTQSLLLRFYCFAMEMVRIPEKPECRVASILQTKIQIRKKEAVLTSSRERCMNNVTVVYSLIDTTCETSFLCNERGKIYFTLTLT